MGNSTSRSRLGAVEVDCNIQASDHGSSATVAAPGPLAAAAAAAAEATEAAAASAMSLLTCKRLHTCLHLARASPRKLSARPFGTGVGGRADAKSGRSYVAWARANPVANNLLIATVKTSAADLMAQVAVERKSWAEIDWKRNTVFCLFGFAYLGGFQYWYQVNIFKRLFPGIEHFTSQPWLAKLRDGPGLRALAAQVILDVSVLLSVYLPTFYVFKAGVFSDAMDPAQWISTGISNYTRNFASDSYDLIRVLGTADVICFSVPLWLRLPVRHVFSFFWTSYLSFIRGSK